MNKLLLSSISLIALTSGSTAMALTPSPPPPKKPVIQPYQNESAHLLAKGTPWRMAETIGDVIEWSYSGNKLHPTQKPVEVLQTLIEAFCPSGGLVLDPFAGSGSTLEAAAALSRRWLGIELDAGYFGIARKRLAKGWRRERHERTIVRL